MMLDIETVSFESFNLRGRYIRHSSFLGVLTQFRDMSLPGSSVLDRNSLEKMDATFIIRRPGLSRTPGSVSFESVNYPEHYLRHQDYRIKLQRDEGTNPDLFKRDASFIWKKEHPLDPLLLPVRLESLSLPRHFIRHQNHELWVTDAGTGDPRKFQGDTTFIPWPGLRPAGDAAVETVSLQSVIFPTDTSATAPCWAS